tara:strand:+ start:1847 stop:2500 length:654 start_codon:yes stop_codon:yes gene_type:complete
MIVETYEEFSNNYHNGLIKENKILKEELNELKELKEKNNGYKALLLCECGVSIERVVEIKNEIKALKKKNKELQTFKEQAEEECSAAPVFEKMIDEIRNLEESYEILEENINELKYDHLMKDDIVKNLILSTISNNERWDFEYKIKNDYNHNYYTINDDYSENVHKYYKKVVKELNDTNWNDDNCRCSLIYDNNYTINVVFNDSSSDDSDSDDSDCD